MGSHEVDANMEPHQMIGRCILLSTFVEVYHAANSNRLHGNEGKNDLESQPFRMIGPESEWVEQSSDLVKRSADGGQRKFGGSQRESKSAFRSGGMQHSAYHGDCGNRGAQCGKPQSEFKQPMFDRRPKVRGGFCTENGAVPWTVQIQVKQNGKYVHRCGGSLLSDQFVLTACHCFGAVKDKDMIVVLGQDDLNNSADPGEVAFQVEKYWLHGDFQKDGPYSHDLALIKLKKKGDGCGARFTPTVSPICLPSPYTTFADNTTCIVSGWGKTKSLDDIHPECLRAAKLPIMNHKQCKKMYAKSSQNIIDQMICAGKIEGGVDACKGDSGGPLVCKEHPDSEKYLLAGVISWGLGCGKAYTPGVFTSVVHYLDWIEEKMNL